MMKSNDHDEENGNRRDVPFPAISAATLASLLGVTPKTVYELTKAGVLQREAGRLFPLEDSVRRYCDYLRRMAQGQRP